MQRSSKPPTPRSRATLRPRGAVRPPTRYTSQASAGRVQKQPPRTRIDQRASKGKQDAYINHDARDVKPAPSLCGAEPTTGELNRQESIHACSEASLEFISLSGLETDEDTNIIALNLMDYFLFSPENWLPDLSYCKLHAACFLFASRITGKSNSVDQIAKSLGPDSHFVHLVGSPLAGDEESAAAIQYMISVTASDVEDGYGLLYERKEMFAYLLGQYWDELENLPVPRVNDIDDAVKEEDENENWDIFDVEE